MDVLEVRKQLCHIHYQRSKVENKYFSHDELSCNCNCGLMNIDSSFLKQITKARELAGVAFVVNSCCRCETHNAEVGSTSNNHTTGHAMDISCRDSGYRATIVLALMEAGFRRIGIYKTFIHVDNSNKPNAIWLGD